jgi:hypothetical protein
MAELLAHPDKDRDFSKSVFDLADGRITITARNGEHLTRANAVYMLELAKQIIINESMEGD